MIFQRLRSSPLFARQCTNRRSFGSIPYSPSHTPGFILYDDITDITLPIPVRTALREGDGEEGRRDGTPEALKPYFKPRFEDSPNANKRNSLLRAVRRPEDIGNHDDDDVIYYYHVLCRMGITQLSAPK